MIKLAADAGRSFKTLEKKVDAIEAQMDKNFQKLNSGPVDAERAPQSPDKPLEEPRTA